MSSSPLAGLVTLASRSAGALGRIAADRFSEAAGKALPRTMSQLARADVVDEMLRHGASNGLSSLPPVSAVRLPGVEFESSNCTNFLVEVDFERVFKGDQEAVREGCGEIDRGTDPKAGVGVPAGVPKTLYVKMPCRELGTRAFANAVAFWDVEAKFCERLASQVPIRVPKVYGVARRGARFVLLLENLQELPGAKLFINRDLIDGTTPDRARLCLSTFAQLHAAFWGKTARDREDLLPLKLHPYLAPGGRSMTRALNSLAIDPAHRAAPDLFTKAHANICRLAISKWDALVDVWYREPLTLIHGDSHLANCFEYPSPDGVRVGMIDFQGLQWCQGIRDVQYHLINSFEPDVLAQHEDALIDHYLAELARHGVHLDAAIAREQYRALSFQTLMVSVISLGLGSLTERDETVRTLLRRSVAAIDRLGFGDWLTEIG